MAERKSKWSEIKAKRGYVSPPRPSLDEQIEAKRSDPEFQARLKEIMERDREVLDRLAD